MFFCLGILLPFGILAQETDPFAAEKAQIREIKLSGDYYYTDVSSEDAEDARLMAVKLLVLEIQSQESGCEKVANLLMDSCRFIRLERIDRPRIFAYITKETVAVWLDGGKPKPAEVAEVKPVVVADTSGVIPEGNSEADVRPDSMEVLPVVDTTEVQPVADTLQVKDVVPVVEDVQPQSDTTAAKAVAMSDSPNVTVSDTVKLVVTDTVKAVVTDTVRAVVTDTVKAIVTDTVKVVIRDTVSLTVTDTVRTRVELRTTGNDRLDRILRMKTIAEVQPYFIAEKKEGRLMFGKMSSAMRPEECYLLFFNREGKVVAFLGKGSTSRLNLLTGQTESVDQYRGNGVIWFLLYE